MYSSFGHKECLKNIYLLSQPYLGEIEVREATDLRNSYLDFLTIYHPTGEINRSTDIFINDNIIERKLAISYSGSDLNDLEQEAIIGKSYEKEIKQKKLGFAENALNKLLLKDEIFRVVFNLAIHSIFVTETNMTSTGYASHGGSASGAIGTIWLSLQKDTITEQDLMELYVHELTHHLIFLDELVHGHFNYSEILHKENFAYSAILNRMRPLDKVIHSIVVATELIFARGTFLNYHTNTTVHPRTSKLVKDVLIACDSVYSLKNLNQLTTDRSIELMERCKKYCFSKNTEEILEAL